MKYIEIITHILQMDSAEFAAFKANTYGTISADVDCFLDAVDALKGGG